MTTTSTECPFFIEEQCLALQEHVLKKALFCDSCAIVNTVASLPARDRRRAGELLNLDLDGVVPNEATHRCPVLDTTMYTPCSAVKCRYHITSATFNNCYYNFGSGLPMSSVEIAKVLPLTPTAVNRLVDEAVDELRRHELRKVLDENPTSEIRYLDNSDNCLACYRPIDQRVNDGEEALYIQTTSGEVGYCSPLCAKQKDSKAIQLESVWGHRITPLLNTAFEMFQVPDIVSSVLGVPNADLYQVAKRYLDNGVRRPAGQVKRYNFLARRAWYYPAWVDRLTGRTKKRLLRKLEVQYGSTKVTLDRMKQAVINIIGGRESEHSTK